MNPDIKDKQLLRLNKTNTIPMPSNFEDNLMENVKSVSKNPEKFINYTKHPTVEVEEHKPVQQVFQTRVLRKPEAKPQLKLRQNPVKEDSVEIVASDTLFELIETDELVEYVGEELEIETAQQTSEDLEINSYCRLCATQSDELVKIFDENGAYTQDAECLKLMPKGLIQRDDGKPQYVCVDCTLSMQSCSAIIDGFVRNQSMFV
jgi:hypothetical protein